MDTGPIVVQKGGVAIGPTTTAGSLYFEHLYALGVDAMAEAVDAIDRKQAHPRPQDELLASFHELVDDAVARIDWSREVGVLDRNQPVETVPRADPDDSVTTFVDRVDDVATETAASRFVAVVSELTGG